MQGHVPKKSGRKRVTVWQASLRGFSNKVKLAHNTHTLCVFQVNGQCSCFQSMELLKSRPAHLAAFLHHVVSQFDPAPLVRVPTHAHTHPHLTMFVLWPVTDNNKSLYKNTGSAVLTQRHDVVERVCVTSHWSCETFLFSSATSSLTCASKLTPKKPDGCSWTSTTSSSTGELWVESN